MGKIIELIIEKLEAYHIFNYILPGALFGFLLEQMTTRTIFTEDLLLNVLIVYFAGMILSRLGSVIVEPILKAIRFVKYADYESYVKAEKSDPKLITLVQENNVFRTLSATFGILILMKLETSLQTIEPTIKPYFDWGWPILLFVLFVFSFRKQSSYIMRRVNSTQIEKDKKE